MFITLKGTIVHVEGTGQRLKLYQLLKVALINSEQMLHLHNVIWVFVGC